MKFISFNINGIRARLHQLEALIDKHQPDIIGLQEIKVHNEQFPLEAVQKLGYHVYYHGQKSHYGVAMLCKQEPQNVQYGFPTDEEDARAEGECGDERAPARCVLHRPHLRRGRVPRERVDVDVDEVVEGGVQLRTHADRALTYVSSGSGGC